MASVTGNYEINVAKKRNADDKYGLHFCKIQLCESKGFEDIAEKKLKFFRELFGDDYHVSMMYWECVGEHKIEWE